MKLLKIKPSKSLNKAYYKQSLSREQIELFKKELQNTFNHIDEKQDEEYHKNVIADLFKNVYCKDKYLVNVNKKEDLVIRLGNATTDDVGVLLEFKKPTEKRDMVSAENANVKALQEIVLYYLRQTVDHDNHKITNLVVTNIYEWFIFDGVWFEKNIFRNIKLKKEYLAYKTSGHDTKYFYDIVAAKYLAEFKEDVPCTYFNLRDYEKKITNDNKKDDDDLIDLYKILSPEHLLNKKFANDSNSLNTDFYNELLYIIGLEESKETAKKTIRRINEAERNPGSFIENTISILKTNKYLGYDKSDEIENQYYETALELCITWLNRILFLKLLESQLINYHKNADADYSFLSPSKISEFDELQELFFDVLAEKIKDRKPEVVQKYKEIPYLNSSLFEQTELEAKATRISGLKDRLEIPVYKKSVLKKGTKEEIKPKTSLKYLLEFLDAYNFASESNAKIQEENKSIINASVLGLIFEKINGYKDGSFFTPGFITMYMCRETIRKAVVEKFKTSFPYCNDVTEFDELKDKIDHTNKAQRQEANRLINDIKIVDPAVGSGHFLVSALNEIIAIKSDLQILSYANGDRVKGYTITLDNDELIIQNQETDKLFEYTLNQNNNIIPELQDLQSCLFTEKQTIIENCLFGVDINPKSVMICQLRLWIELLKNAYYTKESDHKELHTLPNIDINIKTGNSLISKFAIKDNVFERITGFQKKLEEYKNWVHIYKNTNDKKAKAVLKDNVNRFKDEFKLADLRVTKLQNDLRKLNGTYYDKYQTYQVFASELTEKELKAKEKLEKEINDKQVEIQQLKDNPIYANAFEWRFEFPEVLDDKGNFIGFDVVIGNPPYLNFKMYSQEDRSVFKEDFKTIFDGKADIYYYFFEQGLRALKPNGIMSYITSRYWVEAEFGKKLRSSIANDSSIAEIIDFKNVTIFDGVGVKTSIASIVKAKPTDEHKFALKYIDSKKITTVDIEDFTSITINNEDIKHNDKWVFGDESELGVYKKIKTNTVLLDDIADCKQGILTGYDKAFVIEKSNDLDLPDENLKPWLKVGDVFKYYFEIREDRKLIYPNEIKNVSLYPKFIQHLDKFKERLENRTEVRQGNYRWFDLHRSRESKLFDSDKLICRYKASQNTFALDTNKYYSSADTTIVVLKKEFKDDYDLKFLLALVNSKLLDFYFKSYGKLMDYRYEYYPGPVGQLRIKKAKNQKEFIAIVDQILSLKKENPQTDTSKLENDIDNLVYQLYELTPEEIDVVKNS